MDEPMKKSGQWPNVAIAAGSDPHEIMDSYRDNKEQDTREKLLDYIWREITTTLTNNGRLYDPNFWYANIVSWLDRQAAITEREVKERVDFSLIAQTANALFPDYQERIAELTAERNELRAEVGQLKARLDAATDRRSQTLAEAIFGTYVGEPQARIAELEAENQRLRGVARKQAESFRKLEQELKEAKDAIRGSHDDDKPGDEKAEG